MLSRATLALQVMGRLPVDMTKLLAAAHRAGGLTEHMWAAHGSLGTFKNAQRRLAAHCMERGPFHESAARAPPKEQPSDRSGASTQLKVRRTPHTALSRARDREGLHGQLTSIACSLPSCVQHADRVGNRMLFLVLRGAHPVRLACRGGW
jgi:hypothetical protein